MASDQGTAECLHHYSPATRTLLRVIVRLDPNRLRQWHLRFVRRLARRPQTRVRVEWMKAAEEELPPAIALLFSLERLIHGLPANDMAAAARPDDFAPLLANVEEAADVVLDFTAGKPRAAAGRR